MSKIYISAIVSFLVSLAAIFGVALPDTPENIEKALLLIISLGALLKTLYERHKKGDVSFLGFKI